MGIISTMCPMILKEGANPPRIVKAVKDGIKIVPNKPELVMINYVDGTFSKKMKRVPKRLQKQTFVHRETVHIAPHGFDYGAINSDATWLVCTMRDQCFKCFVEQFRQLRKEKQGVETKKTELEQKNKALEKENKELQKKLSLR